jgi:hypothetical protein
MPWIGAGGGARVADVVARRTVGGGGAWVRGRAAAGARRAAGGGALGWLRAAANELEVLEETSV